MKKLWKIIRELIYPDLKSNKHYEYTDEHQGNCTTCGKKRKRGMYSRDQGNDDFFCVECYVRDKGSELKITLPKRKLALSLAGLSFLLITQLLLIIYLLIPAPNVSRQNRDAIVNFFYPYTDRTVSRSTLETQIDTIISKSKYPELSLSIWFHESRGNPSAVSSTGARGPFQIINGWVKKLKDEGIINDERDLHDPVKGCIAGNAILGFHLSKANGDLMAALRDYVGDKSTAGDSEYVRAVLSTYGNIKLLEVAVKEKTLPANMDKWWVFNKDSDKKQLKPTNRSRK